MDAFVLDKMRQNTRRIAPSKPRSRSAETQPTDAFVLPKICSKLCCQNSPIATVDDGAIGPTMPAANVDPVSLQTALLYTDKFKNVWVENRCLRCYSSLHRERNCPVYTKTTASPCSFCWYLYHYTGSCNYLKQIGKSRPASKTDLLARKFPMMHDVKTPLVTVGVDTDCDPDQVSTRTILLKMITLLQLTKIVIAKIPDDPTTDPIDCDDCAQNVNQVTTDSTDALRTEVALAARIVAKIPLLPR